MSKPVKQLVQKELTGQFTGLSSLAVVGFSGLGAVKTNEVRGRLRGKRIRVTVVKNSLARRAFRDMGLEAAVGLMDGPCAVAWGEDPDQAGIVTVVRELLEVGKEAPQLTVKAALLDGQVFRGVEEVRRLSNYPTRQEAVAQVLGCVLSAGAALSASVMGAGAQVAALVKAVEERASSAEAA